MADSRGRIVLRLRPTVMAAARVVSPPVRRLASVCCADGLKRAEDKKVNVCPRLELPEPPRVGRLERKLFRATNDRYN